MAGHMGDARVTTQNLEIVATDPAEGLILIRGAVPGSKGGYVLSVMRLSQHVQMMHHSRQVF